MYNNITIVGNVGSDSDLKYTSTGIAVLTFSVAVNKSWGKGENKQTKTTWFKCSLWRERAETMSAYIKKGGKIMVVGEVGVSSFTDKQGQPQASLEINVNTVVLLGDRPDSQGEHAQESTGDLPF